MIDSKGFTQVIVFTAIGIIVVVMLALVGLETVLGGDKDES